MIAKTSFVRPANVVVLNAKSLEYLNTSIIHAQWNRDFHDSVRMSKPRFEERIERKIFCGVLELRLGSLPRIIMHNAGYSNVNCSNFHLLADEAMWYVGLEGLAQRCGASGKAQSADWDLCPRDLRAAERSSDLLALFS